jgi:hypothetical protein
MVIYQERKMKVAHTTGQFEELKGIANRVAFAAEAQRFGVEITIYYTGEQYFFNIWTVRNGATQSHKLLAYCTSEERLKAHAAGFIASL